MQILQNTSDLERRRLAIARALQAARIEPVPPIVRCGSLHRIERLERDMVDVFRSLHDLQQGIHPPVAAVPETVDEPVMAPPVPAVELHPPMSEGPSKALFGY